MKDEKQRVRHQFLLEPGLSKQLERLASVRSSSKSSIMSLALKAWIDQRGEIELDQRYAKRLDRLSRDHALIKRDVTIVMETLFLFAQVVITLNAHAPQPDAPTLKTADLRFQAFIDQIGRNLASGKRPITLAETEASEGKPS